MPNIDSAKKRARQTPKKTAVNHARKNRVRSFTRKVEEALAAGDRDAALKALKVAEPELIRAGAKGVIHRNTAQRKVSRLARRAAKLGAK
ncbi:MAG TPA: 30S ribosomal protein S20 [Rhizomicrobium sp.]|nr:30S ribosomal protein S20 [Rhizomicrobium sp.]